MGFLLNGLLLKGGDGDFKLVDDSAPQLGGNLDINGYSITGTGNIDINGEVTANTLIGALRGEVCFQAKAGEAITKGQPIYISNFDVTGNKPIVGIADADDINKMPAFGLAKETAGVNANININTFGTLSNIDTSSFNLGDILYVSTSGTLTATKPTGESAQIQNVGKVQRVHATNGSIKVGGAGRTNDTPNLNDGNVFIGNASNQTESRALTYNDINGNITVNEGTFLDGINVGFSGTITTDRINVADANFYLDRSNSNFPLLNFDVDDYIGFNRSDTYFSTVVANEQILKTDSEGMKIKGDKALSIGGDNSDTPPATPLAQLYLGGVHNTGYNSGTKILVDSYDNETSREVMKFVDENDNVDFLLQSGINYPILTSRGQTIFSEANRTTYGLGVDLDDMKTAGIYMVGVQATNLPPQRDTNESSYVMNVYTWGSFNGIQILYSTDRDSTTKHNAIYSRCWESTSWTDWNCVSSTPETLCDLSVSIGSTYTNFTVGESLTTINARYKQILIMYESSTHDGSIILAPSLAVNETFEIGKYSTRYVNFKTPTSTSSTTWQAAASGVTLTRIRMIGYR